MATARVASNHSSPHTPPQSLEGSGSGGSHKSLSPLNIPSLGPSFILSGTSDTNNTSTTTGNGNTPHTMQQTTFTREEVYQIIQHTVRSLQREQLRAQHAQGTSPQRVPTPECQAMKPRVHLYEHHPHSNPQVPTCSNRSMVATLELPGLTKSDIAITARPNGDLVVTGERRPLHLQPSYLHYISSTHGFPAERKSDTPDLSGRMIFNELKFGRFQRTLRLPEGTDVSIILFPRDIVIRSRTSYPPYVCLTS